VFVRPEGVSAQEGASVPVNYLTAWRLIVVMGRIDVRCPGAKLAHCVVLLDAHALGLAEHLNGFCRLFGARNSDSAAKRSARQGRRHSAEFRVRRPKLLSSLCAPLLSNWS
jgi:NADPH:quinone reductase-like Zn-dependent oxidoreductase